MGGPIGAILQTAASVVGDTVALCALCFAAFAGSQIVATLRRSLQDVRAHNLRFLLPRQWRGTARFLLAFALVEASVWWFAYAVIAQRASVDHYTDGVQNGMHTSWYSNGSKAIEGEYRGGQREGVWHRWDPNGFKEWTDVYKDDTKLSGDVSDGPKTRVP